MVTIQHFWLVFSYLARAISRENLMAQKSKMTDNCLKLSKYEFQQMSSFIWGNSCVCYHPHWGEHCCIFTEKKLHKCFFFPSYSHVLIKHYLSRICVHICYVFQVIFAHFYSLEKHYDRVYTALRSNSDWLKQATYYVVLLCSTYRLCTVSWATRARDARALRKIRQNRESQTANRGAHRRLTENIS